MPSRNEIVESNDILQGRKCSRAYLESNEDYLSEVYSGKDVIAVTSEGETEIAAAFNPKSENHWEQALDAIKETYGEEGYFTAVCRTMEK